MGEITDSTKFSKKFRVGNGSSRRDLKRAHRLRHGYRMQTSFCRPNAFLTAPQCPQPLPYRSAHKQSQKELCVAVVHFTKISVYPTCQQTSMDSMAAALQINFCKITSALLHSQSLGVVLGVNQMKKRF